jgi:hypothetical protein
MKKTVILGMLSAFILISTVSISAAPTQGLSNGFLSYVPEEPGKWLLKNNLSGRNFRITGKPFELVIELEGNRLRLGAEDFSMGSTDKKSYSLLILPFTGQRNLEGLEVKVVYSLEEDAWYVRKSLRIKNGMSSSLKILDVTVDEVNIEGIEMPEEPKNPVFLDGQLFWGMEWPIADVRTDKNGISLMHYPAVKMDPGQSFISKVVGFGVSKPDEIEAAFGRYIQDIRINRVDFTTLYFDWLCHDNSGPLESEILANFAVLKKLRELYGFQFDIYNSDAGLVESQGTYFAEYRTVFDKRFPQGLKTIADAARELNMKLGLWIGPDGFGETPESMAIRQEQLIEWVRDFNVGLFKLDTVVSPLRHKDKYILEKKYQSLVDALKEARRIDPDFVAINHRVNQSPYMLTITDCLLWRGQETYIDVHISNTDSALYNRSCSIGRSLYSEFFGVPFRQFEDHGICFNSLIENWEDDFVTQAFGRASVISPEMYGTFFFLPDEDYPRLARLIQLHKRSHHLLIQTFPLENGDVAHGDGRSSLIVLRNPTWESMKKSIRLDETIGLVRNRMDPMIVRQRHPYERLLAGPEDGVEWGDTIDIELEPFDVRLIQVDSEMPEEPFIGGVPYEIVPSPEDTRFNVKLVGEPGQKTELEFYNFAGLDVAEAETGASVRTQHPFTFQFAGTSGERKYFELLGICADENPKASNASLLPELAKFKIDDDALEMRELRNLKERPSRWPEVEVCREYMWDKVIAAEGSHRNAFDGDPKTRWSDGYPQRSPFTGSPVPYRSDNSLWRIDMGQNIELKRLELDIVRKTDSAFIEAVELSPNLETWTHVSTPELPSSDDIPFLKEIRRRGQTIRIYDVDAGDGKARKLSVELPMGRHRYIRIHGRNFSLAEIRGYTASGAPLDRSEWRATNFFGPTSEPRRVLHLDPVVENVWPGQEIAVSVSAEDRIIDPIDGVYVTVSVDGEVHFPEHRVPSYPYHNYEWNCSWLKRQKLSGLTFRLPVRKEWKGKRLNIRVFLFGEEVESMDARVYRVTPRKPFVIRVLEVSPAAEPGVLIITSKCSLLQPSANSYGVS